MPGTVGDIESQPFIEAFRQMMLELPSSNTALAHLGFPGSSKSTGQLQISASLLFDVFSRHEPNNRLLLQAQQEVLDDQLEISRLEAALERAASQEWLHVETPRPSPLAFPLLVERLNNRMSNESVLERVQRIKTEVMKQVIPEKEHQKCINSSRLHVGIWLSVILVSIVFQSWLPVLYFVLPNYY